MRHSYLRKILFAFFVVTLTGCAVNQSNLTPLNQSEEYYNYLQPSYAKYLTETEAWMRVNRSYISDDREKELTMNMPFEMIPENGADKAILLVHGLGDSPYSFADIGESLMKKGFHVQSLLLPGHGSNPEHMKLPTYEDWQIVVDHYATLLKQQYSEVWLGGFSTGANLITIHSIENNDIDGLFLFSPGYQTFSPFAEKLAPLVSIFYDGWITEEVNTAKYSTAYLKGGMEYSRSAQKLRSLLADSEISIPTMIVVSEKDSVIDAEVIVEMFDNHFSHPSSRLVWYGSDNKVSQGRVITYPMYLPEYKISTASHMSPLFREDNPHYGRNGEMLMCDNSFSQSAQRKCLNGGDVWFSAWGYSERGKIFARLTWNPYYQSLENIMHTVASSNNHNRYSNNVN